MFNHEGYQMVTDEQVRMLMTLINKEKTLAVAAAKAGMTEKTARKYRDQEILPSQLAQKNNFSRRLRRSSQIWLSRLLRSCFNAKGPSDNAAAHKD